MEHEKGSMRKGCVRFGECIENASTSHFRMVACLNECVYVCVVMSVKAVGYSVYGEEGGEGGNGHKE